MAYICTITAATKRDNNNIGDVVSIQDVSPNEKERTLFGVTEVKGTAAEVYAQMQSALPERKMVWLDGTTGEYKEIIKQPVFPAKYENGEFSHNYAIDNSVSVATKITATPDTKIVSVE